MFLCQNYCAFFSLFLFSAISTGIAQAQVVPDDTIPTVVEQIDNMDKITGGERVGNNLFHSFEQFSVSEGMAAIFDNAADIENIYTRVTGRDISLINGLLKTNGAANFFLINSNGVVFGENARLDVGGSFLATTANSIVFADGKTFGMEQENQNPILTITAPVGLGFLGNNGSITVNGGGNQIKVESPVRTIEFSAEPQGLSVSSGQTLALVGNGLNFNGGVVLAKSGQVYLTSIHSGSIKINQTTSGLDLIDDVIQYQDINLNQQSLIDASGESKGIIFLNAQNINLLDASYILAQNQSSLDGGSINIKASETLSLKGKISNIRSNIRSETFGDGKGANINIFANQLSLQDGARIRSNSFSSNSGGNGGNIQVNISDSINLSNSSIIATTFDKADGGNLSLSTSKIKLDIAGVSSSTFGEGNGGDLIFNADLIEISGSSPVDRASISTTSFSDGNTGNLTLNTAQLSVLGGASLSSSSFGNGNAGNLTLNASKSLEVSGKNNNSPSSNNPESTVRSAVQTVSPQARKALGLPEFPSGNSGNLIINTPLLKVTNEGVITVENQGKGIAGTLDINVEELTLEEAGKITANAESGIGGDIKINTVNLNITNDSKITSTAGGNENGGNITINTSNLNLKKNSEITANSFEGDGGNIEIDANLISLNNLNKITAASSSGDGGNIFINTDQIELENNSNISASAGGKGNGGNIFIETDFLIANPEENSDIVANAEFGNGGNISIEALNVIGIEFREELTELSDITVDSEFGLNGTVTLSNPDNNIIPIELNSTPNVIDANTIFTNSYCRISQDSQFIITGRGGLPLEDYREMLPEYTWEDWRTIETEQSHESSLISPSNVSVKNPQNISNSISMVQGWKVNHQGQIILTAEPVMVIPQVPYTRTPGCN